MNRRGFLRSTEGIYPLSPKITIIGRESCDFIIQNITIDSQQAMIEYMDSEDCFVLKDLNSTHGTYVNDCRVQNASVRLNDKDILKFGFSAGQYEFYIERFDFTESISDTSNVTTSYGNVQPIQLGLWQSNSNSITKQSSSNQQISLPVISYSQPQQIQHRHTVSGAGLVSLTQLPRPPISMRSGRPLSANSLNRRQISPTAPQQFQSSHTYSRRGSISGPLKHSQAESRTQQNEDQKFLQLQMEVDRLRPFEIDVIEKSHQIESLIQQNNELLYKSLNDSKNEQIYNQIQNLSEEVSKKQMEIDKLHNLLERISENVNKTNSNSSNNEPEICQMKMELEAARKDLKISYGLVTTLQKDLSSKEETINKLNRDNQSLTNELTEKNVSISVLMNKVSRFKDIQDEETDKQDREREIIGLRHKLTSADTTILEQTEKIDMMSTNLEKYIQADRINSEALKDLNKQLDEGKGLIVELQQLTSLLRVDIQEAEKKHEKFRDRVLHVVLSIPGFKAPDQHSLRDDEIIEMMKELVKSKIEHDRRMCEKQKLVDESLKKYQKLCDEINLFQKKLNESHNVLSSSERTSGKINDLMGLLESIDVIEELIQIRDPIIKNLSNEMLFLSNLESCISNTGPELVNLSLSDCFKQIVQRCTDAVESKTVAESKLNQTMESYEEKIAKLKKAQQAELELQSQQLIEKERAESDRKFQIMMEELSSEESDKRDKLTKEFKGRVIQLEEDLENLKKELQIKNQESENYFENWNSDLEKLENLTKRFLDVENELSEVTGQKVKLEQSICEQLETVALQCKSEINLYKEESAQHAITIDSLNDRLIKLNKENVDLKNQITKIKVEKKNKKKESESMQEGDDKNEHKFFEMANQNAMIANHEKCISALRCENVILKNKIDEYDGIIKSLNMDLAGAEARLSDLKGELSESQKNEIDNLKMEIKNLEEDGTSLRVKMAKFTGIVDRLNQDLNDQKSENEDLNKKLSETRAAILDKETKVLDLENQMEMEKETWIKNINQIEQDGRILNELATLGSQCRGDRHMHIIDSQKLALSELRQKLKTLELSKQTKEYSDLLGNFLTEFNTSAKPDLSVTTSYNKTISAKDLNYKGLFPNVVKNSNVPEMTQKMMEMKRELAELRSKKALKDVAPPGMNSLIDIISLKERSKKPLLEITDGDVKSNVNVQNNLDSNDQKRLMAKMDFDLEVEKSNNADLQQSLHFSEKTYLNLMHQISLLLEIEDSKWMKTFDNLGFEGKEKLRSDRDDICAIVVQKIRILKERIQRKEELLLEYEQDLVKLKQAEDLAVKTQSQLEKIFQEMRCKGEEVELLRETLNRTKDLLNQEKRMNTAIKKNKNFIPEKPSTDMKSVSPTVPKYHCPPEEFSFKDKIIEKNKLEKNKRKDYEIKSLKAELYRKEKELSQATNRLYTLENSMSTFYIGVDVGSYSVRVGLFNFQDNKSPLKIIRKVEIPILVFTDHNNIFEQSSDNIWNCICEATKKIISEVQLNPILIKGIGFDGTCSLVALNKSGEPLSISKTNLHERNIIMWMDMRAKAEADFINNMPLKILESFGGKISVEMQPPKLIWLKKNIPNFFYEVGFLFDLPDYLVYRATGFPVRSFCSVTCKWAFDAENSSWDKEFWIKCNLEELCENNFSIIGNQFGHPGDFVGSGLTELAANELGLIPNISIPISLIDAYAGVLGAITDKKQLITIAGTSCCHLMVMPKSVYIEGIWGPYKNVLIKDYYVLEAGQITVGNLLDKILTMSGKGLTHQDVEKCLLKSIGNTFDESESILNLVSEKWYQMNILTKDIHINPDFAGNRNPRCDSEIRGAIVGLNIDSSIFYVAKLYLATIQAIIYGFKEILDKFLSKNIKIESIVLCGGLSKNSLFSRVLADVSGLTVILSQNDDLVLLGAATLNILNKYGLFETKSHLKALEVQTEKLLMQYHKQKFLIYKKLIDFQCELKNAISL